MVKNIFIFLLVFLVGCFPSKNVFEKPRFKLSRFSIKPNTNKEVFSIIDTTCFYKWIKIDDKDYFINSKSEKQKVSTLKSGLKFYKNGKVGNFWEYDASIVSSVNPERAEMGLYNYTEENGLRIQFIYYHVQSGYFIAKNKLLNKVGDTLVVESIKTAQGGGDIYKYVKETLPKAALKYKPDW